MPEVGLGHRVPGPVGRLGVGEDDARARVLVVVVAPHVEVALGRARRRAPRGLEPRVLVRGVVDDQLGDDAQLQPVRLLEHLAEVVERAVLRVDLVVVGDVVAVVLERRGVERHQPDRVDAEVLDVAELGGEALEVADAVVVGIEEGLDVELVDDRIHVPVRLVARQHERRLVGRFEMWSARCIHDRAPFTGTSPNRARHATRDGPGTHAPGSRRGSRMMKLRAPCQTKLRSVSRSSTWN